MESLGTFLKAGKRVGGKGQGVKAYRRKAGKGDENVLVDGPFILGYPKVT